DRPAERFSGVLQRSRDRSCLRRQQCLDLRLAAWARRDFRRQDAGRARWHFGRELGAARRVENKAKIGLTVRSVQVAYRARLGSNFRSTTRARMPRVNRSLVIQLIQPEPRAAWVSNIRWVR